MNALPVGIPKLLAGRPDTQAIARACSSPSGDQDGGGAPDHPYSPVRLLILQPVGGTA